MATGTTPSASAASVLPQPHVATRSGASAISVSPKACSIVTGKAPSDAAAPSPAPVAASVVRAGAAGEGEGRGGCGGDDGESGVGRA